jgi:all-trans-retinol dehydrogenase (NAD+)
MLTYFQTSNAECEKLFKVNLTSHFTLIREFLPGMLRKEKGHIVTIASMASFVAAPGLVDYCCSKVAALYISEGQ